jgi:hypothetical protein
MGGQWYLFDATGISPITGLIRIGTGRDAGRRVVRDNLRPRAYGHAHREVRGGGRCRNGIVPPVLTDLAVSTAE